MRLCMVVGGLSSAKWRLQPWRYLIETARSLRRLGHEVTLISNQVPGATGATLEGVPVSRIREVRPLGGGLSHELTRAIQAHRPDRIVWHIGLSSFYYFDVAHRFDAPSLAVFTSPIYAPGELTRIKGIWAEYHALALHLAGLAVPRWMIKRTFHANGIRHLVTLSNTARDGLIRRGAPASQISVIRPGMDSHWLTPVEDEARRATRHELGISEPDPLVVYAGAPMRFRGLDFLVSAFAQARREARSLRLLVLSRGMNGEYARAEQRVKQLAQSLGIADALIWRSGFLSPLEVKRYMAAADMVALPFRIVPSDMPLSVLEAQALGKPVLTTTTSCLPELVEPGTGITVSPVGEDGLAQALTTLALRGAEREAMGRLARQAAEKWGGWDALDEHWSRILRVV